MTLKSQIAEDTSIFFDTNEFAENIGYTSVSLSYDWEEEISAIVNRRDPHQEEYVRGVNFASAELILKKVDVPDIKFGDTFFFDSSTWEFKAAGIYNIDDNLLAITVERRE